MKVRSNVKAGQNVEVSVKSAQQSVATSIVEISVKITEPAPPA